MFRMLGCLFLIATALSAYAVGPLDDAALSIDRISKLKDLQENQELKRNLLDASVGIDRAMLTQSIQVETFTKRIADLEATVKTQQIIISNYEEIIAKLKAQQSGGTK